MTKTLFLVETAIFYGPPAKFGLFSARPSELETGPSDVTPGMLLHRSGHITFIKKIQTKKFNWKKVLCVEFEAPK